MKLESMVSCINQKLTCGDETTAPKQQKRFHSTTAILRRTWVKEQIMKHSFSENDKDAAAFITYPTFTCHREGGGDESPTTAITDETLGW